LLVLKWFILTLKGQYTRRETTTGSEKKPFNPVLGEQFIGSWPAKDERGETTLVSEQVSHHPPITAYFLENRQARVTLQGHCAQKASFSARTITVRQVGHAILRITLHDNTVECYLITLPKLRIEGLWYGAPYVELCEQSFIQSSTGWHASIEYKGKGYFTGKSHTFKAIMADSFESISKPRHIIEGQWTGSSSYTVGNKGVFCDASASGITREIVIKPIEEQGEYESRRIWKAVADGIRKGDFENATAAKTKLENEQRQKRKDEAASCTPYQLVFFKHDEFDKDYEALAGAFDFQPSTQEGFHRIDRGRSMTGDTFSC